MPTPSPACPQPGDLLLYRGSGRWYQTLITHYTHGPFVHVECCVSPTQSVGALTSGIALHDIPDGYTLIPAGAALRAGDAYRVARALRWLARQQHDAYGWDAILAEVPEALLPRWLGSRTPFLVMPHTFDCSELALRFLMRAGFDAIPDDLYDCPERCSPNDIARMFGIPLTA